MAKGIERNRRRRTPTEPNPADLLWELDQGTADEAWTTPWLTWTAPALLAIQFSRQGLAPSATSEPEHALHVLLRAPPSTDVYEGLQNLRRHLPYRPELSHRQQRWLTATCLIAEAGIANSTAGGLLPGTLMLDVVRTHPDEGYKQFLEEGRVTDALGGFETRRQLSKATLAFRDAWRAGRFRLAYALARAARGLP